MKTAHYIFLGAGVVIFFGLGFVAGLLPALTLRAAVLASFAYVELDKRRSNHHE